MGVDCFSALPASAHRAERSKTKIRDAAEVSFFFRRAYGTGPRLSASADTQHARTLSLSRTHLGIGPVAINEIRQVGHVRLSADPIDKAIVVWVTRGTVSSRCDGLAGRAAAGEITVLAQHDLPARTELHDLNQTSLVMDPSLLARAAGGDPGGDAVSPIRFLSFAPKDPAAGNLWKQSVRTVRTLLSSDSVATPLVLGNASRLLAAVTLAVFPHSTGVGARAADRTDHHPVLLRRAVEFIEANVYRDIGLTDIATAVHLTPRAVQYMFRRHLDTTPTQFLRQVRMNHAHQDLLAGARPHDTVTAIAARWGFMHTGRFAALYRQTYGHSPHATLRGDDGFGPWLRTRSGEPPTESQGVQHIAF
ncbi:helix-turn-helix transcriptional regulator [Mycolicibacterium sp. 120270]|uniref:helix-turn-helix transcriptional regulator n=1 Tax=Mycolicibacterium sp. 120270 TaxID=3090600 RepID=UPI00299DFC44|nr:helix-turn-helix transcriptional regulator [Mycolicibacterium sp. 120270]MDX1883860.1 helix-turn-helix transcriptional regulator [Mycolicibacterium sp. 120270]